MTVGRLLAVAVFSLVLLSACAGSVDGPVIEGHRSMGGETALIEGTLQFEDGCLYLGQPGTDERYPVVWPHGTSWDEDESAVVLPGGTLAYAGDSVSGGGGIHDAGSLDSSNAEGRALAEACVDNTYNEVAVFNSGENVEVRR